MSRMISAVGAVCLLGWTMTVDGAALVDAVQLVSSTGAAASAAPAAQTLTIGEAGNYTVTLDDLSLPAQLASLSVALVNSTTSAIVLSAVGAQTSSTVALVAGTYTVQVLATAAANSLGGTFSVQVAPAGSGANVFQFEDTVGPPVSPPNSGQTAASAQFTVSSAGSYQLTASDLTFPVPLQSLSLGIFVHCGTTPGCTPSAVYTTTAGSTPHISATLNLAAGTYDLFTVTQAASPALQGLFSVQISAAGSTAFGTVQAVGNLAAPVSIGIPATGLVSLQLSDLSTPAPLSSLAAIVAQDGVVLAQVSGAASPSFTAGQGTAELFVAAQPASGGQGAYEAYLTQNSQLIGDIAQPVLAPGSFGYSFTTPLTSAGAYRVSVNDFQKPTPLASLIAITAQKGALLGSTQASPNFNAVAGPLNVLVFPTLATSTSEGLLGVTIGGPVAGATAFQTTQGVGTLFSSQSVTVTAAGTYDLNLTDFAFPEGFSNLALIATSGNTVVGSIFNAGQLQLDLTSGTYVLSVLAQVGPSANYGLYGLYLAPAPPAPTVTLTSSASSVTNGQSAMLTWSSTNATSCTASGGWNGSVAISGSQSTGALTQNGSFTLTCKGGGGTGTATVNVAVTAAAAGGAKGGGGAMTPELLLALAGLLALTSRRQRAHRQGDGICRQ